MTESKVMTVAEACAEIGLSEPTMRRRAADDPTFPRKIRLSARRVGYLRVDIEAFLARRYEESLAEHNRRIGEIKCD